MLQAFAIAWPWGGQPLWWLQWLSLAVLAALLPGRTGRQAFLLGWTFATAWLTATFWWLFISMHTYGGLAAWMAALAVLGLAAFLALYYAAAAGLFARWAGRSAAHDAWLFAALWLAAELLRGTLFTGFPWGAGGYAHVDGPMAALAPWLGVYGLGAVAAAIAFLAGQVMRAGQARSWRFWSTVAAMGGLLAAANVVPTPGAGQPAHAPVSVALLQGNIPQDEKFQGGSGIPQALEWYGRGMLEANAAFVVAPETALPLLPHQLPEGYLQALREGFSRGDRAALVGIPLGDFETGYTNSALGFRPGADVYRYDKHHLVPFGEFIPPLFKWFTRMMNIPLGDFARGGVGQPSFPWRGERFAPNVCYEDLFGEEFAARFRDPAQAPTVFVNISNIGWFGDSVAIDQHLQISRMRALEFRRPMLRATNTGATAIIDRHGRVTHALQRHTRGVLVGEVRGNGELTPFAWWASRFGLWPLWLAVAAVVGWALLNARRARAAPAAQP